MDNTNTFSITPKTMFRCYPKPVNFENGKIKSIYKHNIDDTKTRLLIVVTCDLQSQNKTITKMLEKQVDFENNFTINLNEMYISLILDDAIIYGPEYFFIIPRDDENEENIFICDHGYWNLQHKSDLDMTLTEYNDILNTNSAKVLSHLDDIVLCGNAIELDKKENSVTICNEVIHL